MLSKILSAVTWSITLCSLIATSHHKYGPAPYLEEVFNYEYSCQVDEEKCPEFELANGSIINLNEKKMLPFYGNIISADLSEAVKEGSDIFFLSEDNPDEKLDIDIVYFRSPDIENIDEEVCEEIGKFSICVTKLMGIEGEIVKEDIDRSNMHPCIADTDVLLFDHISIDSVFQKKNELIFLGRLSDTGEGYSDEQKSIIEDIVFKDADNNEISYNVEFFADLIIFDIPASSKISEVQLSDGIFSLCTKESIEIFKLAESDEI